MKQSYPSGLPASSAGAIFTKTYVALLATTLGLLWLINHH